MPKDKNNTTTIKNRLTRSYFTYSFCFTAKLFSTSISIPKDIRIKGQNFKISPSKDKLKKVDKKNITPTEINTMPRVKVPTLLDCIIHHHSSLR